MGTYVLSTPLPVHRAYHQNHRKSIMTPVKRSHVLQLIANVS